MNSLKENIRSLLYESGAVAVGFTEATPPDPEFINLYSGWIRQGKHAGMTYLARHEELKKDPSFVLPGAKTIICLAFNYRQKPNTSPLIASYALNKDYHKIVRKRLAKALKSIESMVGSKPRVCIDSAPLPERYWATKAGIGYPCDNGSLCIYGYGQFCFLSEILLDILIEPDTPPPPKECLHCGKCREACPTKALEKAGIIDCRKCLSWITIEHKGILPDNTPRPDVLFGCDRCMEACPLNETAPLSGLKEFSPNRSLPLTPEAILKMNEEEFNTIFAGSPLRRAGLHTLKRNASFILKRGIADD